MRGRYLVKESCKIPLLLHFHLFRVLTISSMCPPDFRMVCTLLAPHPPTKYLNLLKNFLEYNVVIIIEILVFNPRRNIAFHMGRSLVNLVNLFPAVLSVL